MPQPGVFGKAGSKGSAFRRARTLTMPPRSRIVGGTVARRDFGHAQGCNLLCGGKRDGTYTQELADDLRTRILNRPQITANSHAPYIGSIEADFGTDVDFATITKKYVGDSNLPDAAHRYSQGHVAGVERTFDKRTPQSRKYRHILRGAVQSFVADANATLYPADQRLFQRNWRTIASRSRSGSRSIICAAFMKRYAARPQWRLA